MMEAKELPVEPVLVTGPILATPEKTQDFLEPMNAVERKQSGDRATKESCY